MTVSKNKTAEVVPIRPAKAKQESEKKWGKEVMKIGFCIVPSLLLRAQRRLGLNPTQLAVLMQLADYWWDKERKPYPSKKALSERLGIGPRQVQRYLAELEAAGLIKRIERRAAHKGKLSNYYDLSGLVERLKALEPEFREVQEETKTMRRQVSRQGGLGRKKRDEPAS
ncbi:MAG: helix-turn-helix domain-containing protein [Candidatus Thiodiazotropha sp.]